MPILKDYTSLINSSLVNLVSILTIVIIGFVVGRFLGKLVYKILNELELDSILARKFGIIVDLEKIIGKIAKYGIYAGSLFYAFKQAGISLNMFYYVFLAVLILLVMFIILETKDYIYNLFIGTFFIDKKFLKPGQKIKIGRIEGGIVKVTSTEIKILSTSNDIFFIPNAVLRKSSLFKKSNKTN